MSDYELVSGPSSPRSTCSSKSSNSSVAGHSASSSDAAAAVLGAICAWSISSPAAQDSVQQASFQAQTKQTFNMTSIKPKLSMRPITTPVNLLVCGASGCGKSSFIRAFAKMLNQGAATSVDAATHDDAAAESWRVSGTGPSADPHAVLLAGADEFAAVVGPLSVPEAGRELLYKLQDCPGYGATLDPAGYLEALLSYIFQQQQKDFEQLHGSRGMPKSLVCGSLAHSVTACLYFLPPHGPSKLDLVLMAGLARHVALLPVVGKADCMSGAEAQECCRLVTHMLESPGEYVAGITSVKNAEAIPTYRPSASKLPFLVHTCSGNAATGPGAAAEAGQAGLGQLMELLTGDEVYGLLDGAWDSYTAFCSAYEAAGKSGMASLVSEACAAATQTCLPSCSVINKLQSQIEQREEEARAMRSKMCNVQCQLEAQIDKAEGLKVRLTAAAAEAKTAKGDQAREARLLDELWTAFKAYKNAVGYSYKLSQYAGSLSADLKKRLPDLGNY